MKKHHDAKNVTPRRRRQSASFTYFRFRARSDLLRTMAAPAFFFWIILIHPSFALANGPSMPSSPSSPDRKVVLKLQNIHPDLSPADTFRKLSEDCETLGITNFDVYGDFDLSSDGSYLRQFERELADEFGKEDAVFMPSGVMAQSIALLIHCNSRNNKQQRRFACHRTSHLLLHEEESYKELSGMEPIILPKPEPTFPVDPMLWSHVEQGLQDEAYVSCLMLELPHRELGGKTTPWEDILKIQTFCRANGIAFHCDGARIFEASSAYVGKSLADLATPFDSIYISFYKGLGGLAGAMLMGSTEFCEEARTWLGRFGGNLFTLLPYATAGWAGYKRQWKEGLKTDSDVLSFLDKKEKLTQITKAISDSPDCAKVLTFDPPIPVVNMVHVYFRPSFDACNIARDQVQAETNVSLFHRLRELKDDDPAYEHGYRAKTEFSMGEFNGNIDDQVFIQTFTDFCKRVQQPNS